MLKQVRHRTYLPRSHRLGDTDGILPSVLEQSDILVCPVTTMKEVEKGSGVKA